VVSLREQINNFPRDSPLIALTYDFDWEILESLIALDRGRRKGSIVVTDKVCYDKKFDEKTGAFPDPPPNWAGKSYFLCPASGLKGTFHPKMILAIEAEKLLMVIGSHNLTKRALESNLEITHSTSIPITAPNYEMLHEIAVFLKNICKYVPNLIGDQIQDFADNILDLGDGSVKHTQAKFLHSFKAPILNQALEQLPQIESVVVLAPTHSSNPLFLQKVTELVGEKITFLIDPLRFSIEKQAKEVYEKFEAKRLQCKPYRSLHAKLYIFRTEKGDWTLYGSPNFTENALLMDAAGGGNVEAAILIPPSANWNWKQLFEGVVTLSELNLRELHAAEKPDEEPAKPQIVEGCGYETLDGKGIILAPGMPNGSIVYIHFYGTAERVKTKVESGKIIFTIPPDWTGTKYEIFNENGMLISFGIINRTRISIPKFEEYNLDEDALREFYRFMRKLQNIFPDQRTNEPEKLPEVVIIDEKLLSKPPKREWNSYSVSFQELSTDQLYSKAKKKLAKTINSLFQGNASLRQLLSSLDLTIESAFYAGLLTGDRKYYPAQVARDLSEIMNLPSGKENQELILDKLENWQPHLSKPLNQPMLNEWKKQGPTSGIDVSLLFNYWLYFQSLPPNAFENRALDAIMVTNRYYQIWKAFEKLTTEKTVKASRERIWDSRIKVLKSKEIQEKAPIPLPSDLKEIETCLQSAFERCIPRLKSPRQLF